MKLLDCTLRDAGYYSNWHYSDSDIQQYCEIINDLKKNYHVYGPEILCSKDFGIPQNRRRIFIIATKKEINYEFPVGCLSSIN